MESGGLDAQVVKMEDPLRAGVRLLHGTAVVYAACAMPEVAITSLVHRRLRGREPDAARLCGPSLTARRPYGSCFITDAGNLVKATAPSVEFIPGDTGFPR